MCLQLHPESSVPTPPVVGSAPGVVVGGVPGVAVGRVPVSPSRVHCGKKGFVQDVIYTICFHALCQPNQRCCNI